MDFFKDQSESLARSRNSAYQEYKSRYEEALLSEDGELFHKLTTRELVTREFYNEHGKTINQMFRTTLESFP